MKSGERKVGDAPAPWRALDHQRNLRPASVRALLRGFSVVVLDEVLETRSVSLAGTVDSGVFAHPDSGTSSIGLSSAINWRSVAPTPHFTTYFTVRGYFIFNSRGRVGCRHAGSECPVTHSTPQCARKPGVRCDVIVAAKTRNPNSTTPFDRNVEYVKVLPLSFKQASYAYLSPAKFNLRAPPCRPLDNF
ncbi:hypothetical protein TcasGA2_TC000260 [Tribolium castaneum]|uniref:Uncharacterized protein n=1 Tax=Tribolium castaneum TaxID=7070 RepID=D6WBQ3_TRICA|nr:hypothetical protein TcasGA2_TC000260 [Tribolium castaneum]